MGQVDCLVVGGSYRLYVSNAKYIFMHMHLRYESKRTSSVSIYFLIRVALALWGSNVPFTPPGTSVLGKSRPATDWFGCAFSRCRFVGQCLLASRSPIPGPGQWRRSSVCRSLWRRRLPWRRGVITRWDELRVKTISPGCARASNKRRQLRVLYWVWSRANKLILVAIRIKVKRKRTPCWHL